jgi:2-polyprenyl-6-methoxyphenol hydroxylase-like FAD-dependent oxidoreductase
VMQQLRVRSPFESGRNIKSYVALGKDGQITHEVKRPAASAPWSDIYKPLREALPDDCYRAGVAIKNVRPCSAEVTAIFERGSESGDVLVAADGINSTVRQQLAPGIKPQYAGYVAWRGIVDETSIAPVHHDLLFNHLIFCFPAGELLLSIPLPAAERGPRKACYIWYRPASLTVDLPDLCTDESGKRHGVTISPPLIRQEVIRNLKAAAHTLLPPLMAHLVETAELPLFQAIFDLASNQLNCGRVALLGDAAFVARPHMVLGVTKAALDAKSLVENLSRGVSVEDALSAYDGERQEFGRRIVEYGRYLGGYLSGSTNISDRPSHLRPDLMLRDYGGSPTLMQ